MGQLGGNEPRGDQSIKKILKLQVFLVSGQKLVLL